MNPNEYQKLAMRTECNPEDAALRIHLGTPKSVRLEHAVVGLFSEFSEIADAVKKYIHYNRQIDVTRMVEELGDCLWYIALACDSMGLDLQDVMATNIAKLQQRYPDKYTDAKEKGRDRKAEQKALEANQGDKSDEKTKAC